jgi:hypothetical protein
MDFRQIVPDAQASNVKRSTSPVKRTRLPDTASTSPSPYSAARGYSGNAESFFDPRTHAQRRTNMLTSVRSPDVESVKARLKIIRANWFTKRGALIVIRSRVRHSSSWGSSAVHVSELSYLRGKGTKTDTKRHPLLALITMTESLDMGSAMWMGSCLAQDSLSHSDNSLSRRSRNRRSGSCWVRSRARW